MPTETEYSPFGESAPNKLLEAKKAEGWNFVAREELTRTQFTDGRFLAVPHQTEIQIREKWLQWAKEQAPAHEFEVDLVLDENTEKLKRMREISTEKEYCNILNNLGGEDKTYLVFLRKIGK